MTKEFACTIKNVGDLGFELQARAAHQDELPTIKNASGWVLPNNEKNNLWRARIKDGECKAAIDAYFKETDVFLPVGGKVDVTVFLASGKIAKVLS